MADVQPHTEPADEPGMCHNGHPFEPGIDVDMITEGRSPDSRWCNVCGDKRDPSVEPPSCPWCKSTDPDKVGVEQITGKVCRDPFHCPDPSGHSANGGSFRYCQYCDWREEPSKEPPAGTAINWAEGGLADTIELDIYTMAGRFGITLTEAQVEQIISIIESEPS